jgi:hypothetical protein
MRTRSAARRAGRHAFGASVLALCGRDRDGGDRTPCAVAGLGSAKKRRDDGRQPGPPRRATSPRPFERWEELL